MISGIHYPAERKRCRINKVRKDYDEARRALIMGDSKGVRPHLFNPQVTGRLEEERVRLAGTKEEIPLFLYVGLLHCNKRDFIDALAQVGLLTDQDLKKIRKRREAR